MGAYKHLVDISEKHLLEGLFSGVVFFEQCGNVSKGPAFVGDDGSGAAGSDYCGAARVDQRDKSGGREGVVDSRGCRLK